MKNYPHTHFLFLCFANKIIVSQSNNEIIFRVYVEAKTKKEDLTLNNLSLL